jgi:cell shape-determining protein MreD
MKENVTLASNVALFLLATLVLGTVQTSLWFQVFGYFPSPAFWLPCLVYVALYRSTLEAIIYSYLTAFVLSTLTSMPEGVLMITCLALSLATQVFKRRFHWTAASYAMLVCGLASVFFHVFHFATTWVVGDTPMTSPAIIDWLVEALLTPLTAPVLFPIFRWFDRLTNRESGIEMSSGTIS